MERHDALFRAFAEGPDGGAAKVDVADVETDEFAHAEARGVHELDHHVVTPVFRAGARPRRLKERLDILRGQDLRNGPSRPRGPDVRHRTFVEHPLFDEEPHE